MPPLPETILQFGSGRFLRAFADLFIHQANQQGQAVGRVVIVQSTGDDRAGGLNAAGRPLSRRRPRHRGRPGRRPRRGVREHQPGPRRRQPVGRGARRGRARRSCARSCRTRPRRATTSTPPTRPTTPVPRSFPAKLLGRAARPASRPGSRASTIVPCELREGNADLLRGRRQAGRRAGHARPTFVGWLADECVWLQHAGRPHRHRHPDGPPAARHRPDADRRPSRSPFRHPGQARGRHVRLAAPGHRPDAGRDAVLPAQGPHPQRRPHGAADQGVAARASPSCARRSTTRSWGRGWSGCCSRRSCRCWRGGSSSRPRFARQTLDRFRNPFLDHKLADIALHHDEQGAGAAGADARRVRREVRQTAAALGRSHRRGEPATARGLTSSAPTGR